MDDSTIPAPITSSELSSADSHREQVLAALRGAGRRGWLGPRARAQLQPAAHTASDRVLQLDSLALAVKAAFERVALPLASTARALCATRGWTSFGYARVEDYARERLGRTGRWLRDHASLGRSLDRVPALVDALIGTDGGRPLGKVSALWVGKVASPDSVDAWIDLARAVSVRELMGTVRRALHEGAETPPPVAQVADAERADAADAERADVADAERADAADAERADAADAERADAADAERADVAECPAEVPDDRCRIKMIVPVAVRAAFDETLCLFRAVNGGESSVPSFIEALVAEAHAGPTPPDVESIGFRRQQTGDAELELALADNTALWSRLRDRCEPGSDPALAADALARFQDLALRAGRGDNAELDRQLRALLKLEDELERRLGLLLKELNDLNAWDRLRFVGLEHYAEQRLGLSRTTVANRVRLARVLRRLPCLRKAYQEGRLGVESALLVVQILGTSRCDPETERAWVDRAQEATVKRLRDELRALSRLPVPGEVERDVTPLDDAAWHGSLMLRPGQIRARVHELAQRSLEPGLSTAVLQLTLPEELAAGFLAAVESARRAVRMFSADNQEPPTWVGVLALLEDFVDTWDLPEGSPSRHADEIYSREGWRCFAPGCTSRKNLEDHHLQYRSRGGDLKDPANRICLCSFHHRRGEHGSLAHCSGQAPLGVQWRLGHTRVGVWFRNERLLEANQVSKAC